MPSSPGGLWRHADFRRLWAARGVSALGSRVSRTALPVIAILLIRAPPGEVAILAALGVAPGVLVGLLAGGRIERARKRPILIGADIARAALVLSVPLAAWLGVLAMPQLYLVAAMAGAATTLSRIADGSLLPLLVGVGQLIDANGKLEAADFVAEAAGPGVAGVLIQVLGAPVSMVLDALSYLASAWMLGRITTREAPAVRDLGNGGVLADIRAGLAAALAHPVVARLLIVEALSSLFMGAAAALYMVLALRVLHLTPAVIGLVISVGGIGTFVGAAVAGRLGRAMGVGPALVVCFCAGQAAALLIPLSASVGPWSVAALVGQQLIGDAFLVAFGVHAVSLRQREVPEGFLARVNATFHVAFGLFLPLGTLAAGALVGVLGLPATLWIGALGGLLSAALLIEPRVWRER